MRECVACCRCLDDQDEVCPDDGSEAQPSLIGSRVLDGKLELERRLGEGGMGAVYQARHLALGRLFAVKLIRRRIPQDAGYVARFRAEAAALGRLKHPAIVDVSDFGWDPRNEGVPYLVMELLDGISLADHCAAVGPMALDAALPILGGIADAVDFAHRAGVVHRDLKPSNVLVYRDASGLRVKLLDFGLARLDSTAGRAPVELSPTPPFSTEASPAGDGFTLTASPSGQGAAGVIEAPREETRTSSVPTAGDTSIKTSPLGSPVVRAALPGETQPGELVGTPAYMAPERFKAGAASPASDVYAIGVIAYFLLTGRTPFSGSLGTIARGHLSEPPPPPSSVHPLLPAGADSAILQALSKRPGERPPTAAALVQELAAVARGQQVRGWYERELPRRLILTLGVALGAYLAAPAVGSLAPVAALERAALDTRLALSPVRAADPRLLVVILDDASLAEEKRALAEMAEPVATALGRVFDAGAVGVAIDLLLPEAWARSTAFAQLAVAKQGKLALAAHAGPEGFVGLDVLSGLVRVALGDSAADDAFGLVNLDEDADGVVRRARLRFSTQDGRSVPSWAAAAARLLGVEPTEPPAPTAGLGAIPAGTFVLDSRDVPPHSLISWKDLPVLLSSEPSRFEGRLVLLGARISGSGDEAFRLAPNRGGRATLPGVLVQARAIDTILAGFPIREVPGPLVWIGTAALAALVVASVLLGRRQGMALIVAVLISYPLVALFVFGISRRLLPVAAPFVLIAGAAILALVLRRLLPARPWQEGRPS